MYKKTPDGFLSFAKTANGKKYSKGQITVNGKIHEIEVYMSQKNGKDFVIYLSGIDELAPKFKSKEAQLYFEQS